MEIETGFYKEMMCDCVYECIYAFYVFIYCVPIYIHLLELLVCIHTHVYE